MYLSLSVSSPKQIVFEGIRGPSFEGDIAIDDVSITTGKCKQENTVASAGKTGKIECDFLEWRDDQTKDKKACVVVCLSLTECVKAISEKLK